MTIYGHSTPGRARRPTILEYDSSTLRTYPPPVDLPWSMAFSSKYACMSRPTTGAATEAPSPPLYSNAMMTISGSSYGAKARVQECVGHDPNWQRLALSATSSQYSAVPVLPATATGSG